MREMCPWCRDKEDPVAIEKVAQADDAETTYGFCASHRLELMLLRYLGTVSVPCR